MNNLLKRIKITEDFKNQIESYISTNNITQANFAKKCNVDPGAISKILSGKQTEITLKKYNNVLKIINNSIYEIINNSIYDNNKDGKKDISVREKGLILKREYDLSISDMSRIFDTDKENIQLLLKGEEVFPDLHAKVLYYFDNKEEFEELCKEKRFIVSKFDKQKIIDKVMELYDLGLDAGKISSILHTSFKKINNILNNETDVLEYPTNTYGRQAFNDIICDKFDFSSDFKDTNLDSYNEIDQEQHNYHDNINQKIIYNRNDETLVIDPVFDDIEEKKMDKIDYICNMLRNDSDHFLPESIDRLIDIISVMHDIDNDKIKIHIDIDL